MPLHTAENTLFLAAVTVPMQGHCHGRRCHVTCVPCRVCRSVRQLCCAPDLLQAKKGPQVKVLEVKDRRKRTLKAWGSPGLGMCVSWSSGCSPEEPELGLSTRRCARLGNRCSWGRGAVSEWHREGDTEQEPGLLQGTVVQSRPAPPGRLGSALAQGSVSGYRASAPVAGGEGESREHSVVCWQVTRSLMHCSKSPV